MRTLGQAADCRAAPLNPARSPPAEKAFELKPDWAKGYCRLGAAFALLMGFGAWAFLTDIDGAIVAPGVIQVEQNRQVVQHPDGGVVAAISVTEAQTVQAGDLLIQLDGTQIKSELAIIEGQLFDSMARRARLEAHHGGRAEAGVLRAGLFCDPESNSTVRNV